MKKDYMNPPMNVVKIRQAQMLCSSPVVNNVDSGDTGIRFGGGGNGSDRSRGSDDWDDE